MNTPTNTPVSHLYMDSDDRNDMPDPITTRYGTEPYYTNVRYEAKEHHEIEARYDTDVRYDTDIRNEAKESNDIPNRHEPQALDERYERHETQIHHENDLEVKLDERKEDEPITKPYETEVRYDNEVSDETKSSHDTLDHDESNTHHEPSNETEQNCYKSNVALKLEERREPVTARRYETEERYDSNAHDETKSSHDTPTRYDSNTHHEPSNEAAQNRYQSDVELKLEERREPVTARDATRDDESNSTQNNPSRYDTDVQNDTNARYDDNEARYNTKEANDTEARYDTRYDTDARYDVRYDETEARYNNKEGNDTEFRYETDARYALKEEQDIKNRYDNVVEGDNVERDNDISAHNADSSPGVRLRHVREKNKWSVKHIADRLFLDVHVIEALEADNYDGLPPTIFVRGYLRNYAKLLELSPESIMESFERLQEQPKASSITPQKQNKQTSSHDVGPSIITGIVIVTLLILVTWAGLRFYPPNPALTPAPELQTPVVTAPQEETPSLKTWSDQQIESNTSLISRLDTDTSSNRPSEPPVSVLTPAIVSQPTDNKVSSNQPAVPDMPQEEVAATPDPRKMILHFKARTWIRITDNTGKKLYEGISNSGKVLPLEGTPPFYLKIGNLDGVDIEYQDETKDIKTFPKRRGRKRLYIVGYEQ
ncbi:MAG: hypothetical protein DRR16_28680 [Candidatus Parabeggiatoa sp. nov. 3]|nr:MAG: hypothetical protein DRR16_28680 [Gammaproteobacteria bacterium]